MNFRIGAKCLLMGDAWETLAHYRIADIHEDRVSLGRFADVLGREPVRDVPLVDAEAQIFVTPYSLGFAQVDSRLNDLGSLIANLSRSWVRTEEQFPLRKLLSQLSNDFRLKGVSSSFVEGCVRSLVASKLLEVKFDGRKKDKVYVLSLSPEMREAERGRVFAGSMASELNSLSERVRHVIAHTGTVGTYRENILQTLLRKNLPERYHVATGFIEHCPRQLDVLIYDRLDYAPLFREGDLVVVPSESVRAVIEVKTTLSKVALEDSLDLLDQVAMHDDLTPPFFRGIFSFESSIAAQDIYDTVVDFYAPSESKPIEPNCGNFIAEAFRHVSAVCVLETAYARVLYGREHGKYRPFLVNGESITGLLPQAALFIQQLLDYLRFGGLKHSGADHIERMLGADTKWTLLKPLVVGPDWGAYFDRDYMDADNDVVEAMEAKIEAVTRWLDGGDWVVPKR